jgi:hypothetical protein
MFFINQAHSQSGTVTIAPGASASSTVGCFLPLPTAATGSYYFTYGSSGSSVISNITISATTSGFSYTTVGPGMSNLFYFNGNNIYVNVTASTSAQFCTSQVITIYMYKYAGGPSNYYIYGTYTLTVNCKDDTKDNLVVLGSGTYYVANDNTIDRLYWDPNLGWQYENITPVGGWTYRYVGGWLAAGDYNTDDIFYKDKVNQSIFHLYKSGGNWYVDYVGGWPVAGCVRVRQDGVFSLTTSGQINRTYLNSSNTWITEQIVPWGGWTVTAYMSSNLFSGNGQLTGMAMELAPWPATNVYFRGTDNKIYNLVGSAGAWGLGLISPTGAQNCTGDITTDNTGVYYKGADNFIHRLYWTSSGWVYDAMTTSNLSTGNTSGHLSKFPGENRVFYKGTDGKLYNMYLSGSQWDVFPLDYNVNTVAGDVTAVGNIFYINTDNRVHNFWWNGTAWVDNALNYNITNAKGCSSNYRIGAEEEEQQNIDATTTLGETKLYPNPSEGIVKFIFPKNMSGTIRMTLYNSMGQLIESEQLMMPGEAYEKDFSALSKGLYMVVLESAEGKNETLRLLLK